MNIRGILQKRREKFNTFNLITIDARRLENNLDILRSIAGMEMIPVLKSNAYGHGIREVASILEKLQVKTVAVDGYFEALQIHRIFSGKILVLSVIDRKNVGLLKNRRISYVLQNEEDLRAFGKLRRKINVHLELNTGMNRLGLKLTEVDNYLKTLKKYKNLHLEGVMTHLASADEARNNTPEKQTAEFDAAVEKILAAGFAPTYFHIANSAGAGRIKSKFANAARAGIGMYGINHLEKADKRFNEFAKLRPVLQLESTIIKVIDLKKGDEISYGGSFTAGKNMRVGVLPLGYYEGVPRDLSSRGIVSLNKQELAIVGRVNMNHTIIDLTETDLKPGDKVTVISKDPNMKNSVIGLQQTFGLFAYETLARLSEHARKKVVYN